MKRIVFAVIRALLMSFIALSGTWTSPPADGAATATDVPDRTPRALANNTSI